MTSDKRPNSFSRASDAPQAAFVRLENRIGNFCRNRLFMAPVSAEILYENRDTFHSARHEKMKTHKPDAHSMIHRARVLFRGLFCALAGRAAISVSPSPASRRARFFIDERPARRGLAHFSTREILPSDQAGQPKNVTDPLSLACLVGGTLDTRLSLLLRFRLSIGWRAVVGQHHAR